ncbi:MAG: S8 family serine peptidase [Polyangiaceae bacterium]
MPNNAIDDDGNGYVDDYYGWDFITGNNAIDDISEVNADHQTHLSGIIAATKGNAAGISGVAPGVKVMHLRASAGVATQINAAINYAKSKGAKIINLSQGGGPTYNIAAVSSKIAAESGILFVCSAGNTGTSKYNYPSSYTASNILSVANADPKGMLWRSSNYGPGYVDIAAPGLAIYSTLPGNQYDYKTGTSQAAAIVSGVSALLLSADPTLTPTAIIQRLKDTGMRVPYAGSLLGTTAIVDAEAALNTVLNVGLTATSTINKITLTWQPVAGATRYQVERDGTMVDNQQSTTFVHSSLTRNSTHIYRVRAQVNGAYGKWTYRILKAASNEPVVENLSPAVEPPRDAQGKYLANLSEFKTVQKSGAMFFRMHFTQVALSSNPLGDNLVLQSTETFPRENRYDGGDALFAGDFWSLWFAAPSVEMSFTSNESGGAFGYKVDKIEYVMP